MAVQGPRTVDRGGQGHGPGPALVRVCDLAGRPRGTGFAVDRRGTVVTSHEAVEGPARLLLHTPSGRARVLDTDAVTPLPYADLALVCTEGLGLGPLPVTARDRIEAGAYVRIAAGGWREARVLGTTAVTYRAGDCCRLLDDALKPAIGTAGTEALRPGGGAAGGPVLDAATGAVLDVLGTRLHTEHRGTGLAVPLRGLGQPLDELLDRNARTVPAYGADLNIAGALDLTTASAGTGGPPDDSALVPRVRTAESSRPSRGARPPSWHPSAPRAAAVRRNSPPSPRGAPGTPSPPRCCCCAERTSGTPTHPWPPRWGGHCSARAGRPPPARTPSGPRTSRRSHGTPGARCCCFSTALRTCRPASPAGAPTGPGRRPPGCVRTGPGWCWPAGRSTGSRPEPSFRRSLLGRFGRRSSRPGRIGRGPVCPAGTGRGPTGPGRPRLRAARHSHHADAGRRPVAWHP
ncbi:trypsin-like peptidase domain-containing protein [Streptomyces glomeratus]|uniref:trypsin-like peptidase domain-containing protein n=1 Tax=Streptomyces glomeratus TaxID=284452 RepID=UPI0031D65388